LIFLFCSELFIICLKLLLLIGSDTGSTIGTGFGSCFGTGFGLAFFCNGFCIDGGSLSMGFGGGGIGSDGARGGGIGRILDTDIGGDGGCGGGIGIDGGRGGGIGKYEGGR